MIEAKVDKEQKDWCEKEVPASEKDRDDKDKEITGFKKDITDLKKKINDPDTGLIALIKQSEDDLVDNLKSQKDETDLRREDNLEYQAHADDAAAAVILLEQAIAALNKFYTDMEANYKKEIESLVQEDPAPPTTWDDSYVGQSSKGGDVIGMLEYVMGETKKEGEALHDQELKDQHAYEDSMAALKKSESDLEDQIVKQKKDLADAEEELEAKQEQLAQTEKEHKAILKYLDQINPGCDFIKDNYADREKKRSDELTALDTAVTKLKSTPAFANAAKEDENEKFGQCKDACVEDGEDAASCKACMAGASLPSYCASHPSAKGCEKPTAQPTL